MRILHVTSSLNPIMGGPARSVPQLAISQSALGHDVSVWAANDSYREFADNPVGAENVSMRFEAINETIKKSSNVDIVHDHGIWDIFHHRVSDRCAAIGVPRVVSPRGMLEPWALDFNKWKKLIAWHTYQKKDLIVASALHATSEAEARQFQKLGLVNQTIILPNGVPRISKELSSVDVNSGDDNNREVLFLGRVHPKKGLDLLINAWADLSPERCRMRVVGPDEVGHTAELRALVASKNLEQQWVFEGELTGDKKWEAYRAADVVVLPSYSENFGIGVAEALVSGTPVISTTGTPWEGLIQHDCGWWVQPDVSSIASALKIALCEVSIDTLRLMGNRGKIWAEQDFSWSKIALEMVNEYESIIARSSV